MTLLVPDVGERNMLEVVRAAWTYEISLFTNNYTPTESDVVADYTAADFDGYAVRNITFTISTTVSGTTFNIGNPVMWQHDGGATSNTIYGYYVTHSSLSVLLWAERFATEKVMASTADMIIIVPRLELE